MPINMEVLVFIHNMLDMSNKSCVRFSANKDKRLKCIPTKSNNKCSDGSNTFPTTLETLSKLKFHCDAGQTIVSATDVNTLSLVIHDDKKDSSNVIGKNKHIDP